MARRRNRKVSYDEYDYHEDDDEYDDEEEYSLAMDSPSLSQYVLEEDRPSTFNLNLSEYVSPSFERQENEKKKDNMDDDDDAVLLELCMQELTDRLSSFAIDPSKGGVISADNPHCVQVLRQHNYDVESILASDFVASALASPPTAAAVLQPKDEAHHPSLHTVMGQPSALGRGIRTQPTLISAKTSGTQKSDEIVPPPGFETNGFRFDSLSPDDIATQRKEMQDVETRNKAGEKQSKSEQVPTKPLSRVSSRQRLSRTSLDTMTSRTPSPPPPASSSSSIMDDERSTGKKYFVPSEVKEEKDISEDEDDTTDGTINMVVIGHVDAGKSTLMGQLLYQKGVVHRRMLDKYEKEAREAGKASFYLAWVMDEDEKERAHGVTMDIGTKHFSTKTKEVTILDAPGHRDFVPRMISGTCQADAALLVIPAVRGEFETGFDDNGQIKEHTLLAKGFGVNQIIVAVNKLDAADPVWSQERFEQIKGTLHPFLSQYFKNDRNQLQYVPVSGLTGENVLSSSEEGPLRKWYNGPSLIDAIDALHPPNRHRSKPFRMSVADIYPSTGKNTFTIIGKVLQGRIKVGYQCTLQPLFEECTLKSVVRRGHSETKARAGENVEVTVTGTDLFERVQPGAVLCRDLNPAPITDTFTARLQVFASRQQQAPTPILKGTQCELHMHSLDIPAYILKLINLVDPRTGEVVKERPRSAPVNSLATIKLRCDRPICVELYEHSRPLGRFVLRQRGVTIAAGRIIEI